jgi:hypothetical protein
MRADPPVSEHTAAAAMPSVTETAAPEDDPPGIRPWTRSNGLRGVPQCKLTPRAETPSSDMLVRPTITAPAAFSRDTTVASTSALDRIRRTFEPASVASPATSNASFIEIGIPWSIDRV